MGGKLKIYFNDKAHLNVSSLKVAKNKPIARLVKFIIIFIFNFFYRVGIALLNLGQKAVIFFTKFKFAIRRKDYLTNFAIFSAILVLCVIILNIAPLIARGIELKERFLLTFRMGTARFYTAQEALTKQDFSLAENNFLLAFQNFQNSQKELKNAETIFSKLVNFIPAKKEAEKIIKVAEYLSLVGKQSSNLTNNLQKLSLSASGLESKEKTVEELIENIKGSIAEISKKLTDAKQITLNLSENNIPEEYQSAFLEARQKIFLLEKSISQLKEVFSLIEGLFFGKKEILIVFENNNELRAGGGFMGSYGRIKMIKGKIEFLKIGSIYDLDGQLKENIAPPYPILNLNERWYLRDSNWFASFPKSSQKIISFYEKEGGETPDTLIALSPNLIIDLLKLTGPIHIAKYNVDITAENFIETTQIGAILNKEAFENQPKQILADLFPLLIHKISSFQTHEWQIFIENLQQNLLSKQIVFFSKDINTQKIISTFNWGGEIKNTDRDFLQIVSSNLEGTKTDLSIKQQIFLSSKIENDGSIINELTITRTNMLPKLDKTYNSSFLRIFVPFGSKLISSAGFDYKNLDFKNSINHKQKIDSDVFEWERNSVKDIITGTAIGLEANKTFFGNWLVVEGGQTKTIKLIYSLPFQIKSIDRHSLMIQKQIGSENETLDYNLSFPNRDIKWQSFLAPTIKESNLQIKTGLNKDYFFGFVFKSK